MARILVAEDDSHLCEGLATLLESEGHACIKAANGVLALELFKRHHPDLCIVDRMMPIMDGDELCRRLRDESSSVPILILSARGEELDRIQGFDIGADDYVVKPFSAIELIARISAILRRTDTPDVPQQFQIGDLQIDSTQLRTMRNGNVIELHAREVAILRHFSNAPGRVISRNELMDVAWNRAYFSSSRAVDQYVSALRKKIELNPRKPKIITTVWGQGYRYDI